MQFSQLGCAISRTMQILLLISLPLIHQAHHRAPSIIRGLTKMKTESWPGMRKRNLCKLTAEDVTWTNTFLFRYAGKNHEFLLFIRQFTNSWEIFCIEGSLTNFDKIQNIFFYHKPLSEIWIWLHLGSIIRASLTYK